MYLYKKVPDPCSHLIISSVFFFVFVLLVNIGFSEEPSSNRKSLQSPADYVNALMGTAPLTDMTLYGGV